MPDVREPTVPPFEAFAGLYGWLAGDPYPRLSLEMAEAELRGQQWADFCADHEAASSFAAYLNARDAQWERDEAVA